MRRSSSVRCSPTTDARREPIGPGERPTGMRSAPVAAPAAVFRPRSRRVALAAAALVIGLAACGSDPAERTTSPSTTVTTPGTGGSTTTSGTTAPESTAPTDAPPVILVAPQGQAE